MFCWYPQHSCFGAKRLWVGFHLAFNRVLFPSQDQYDQIEKHTQSGIDLLELYIKFVKERTEIEQSYAKQLRCAFL